MLFARDMAKSDSHVSCMPVQAGSPEVGLSSPFSHARCGRSWGVVWTAGMGLSWEEGCYQCSFHAIPAVEKQ